MISLQSLVSAVVYLIIGGLIVWLLLWLIDYLKLPEPFGKVARVVIVVVSVLIVISVLLGLAGHPIVAV